MAANFWRDMEEPSHDMSELAFELFDRYGYLNAKFKDHCIQRGTGVWGAEMDNGPLFLIERTIVTDRDLRGKGIGRAMISLMIQKAQTREKPQTGEQIQMSKIFYGEEDLSKYSTLHAVVVPGWLRSDVEPLAKGVSRAEKRKIYNQACDDAVAFYRTFGFRRIGASSCFGYSFDPAHKSRAIEASADYDPPEPPEEDLSEDEGANPFDDSKQQKKMDRLRDKLPLHHATLTLPDKECVAFYKGFLDHSGIEWKQSDRLENNVLHVAACQQKPESVKWIMENANTGTVLSSSRNIHGYTPLEALQDVLEIGRTRKEVRMLTLVVADQFEGFNTDAVDCLSLLTGLDPRTMSKIQRQRLKFGCTCGECLDGFMSPRMCAALLFQAETTCDMLDMDIGNGPDWCMSNDYMFTYVAPDLRQNFRTNKSYREGFKNIFGFMAECLRAKMLPVRDNVLLQWENESEWPPVTRNYLQRGGTLEGKIEPALRICFDHAQEQGEKTGDGEYERVMKNEVPLLKKCRNDDEFRFVAVQCGLPAQEYY
ncbi:uncharacterized protein LY89DRAFT_648653 [Mollisia scopiformis]|uniref:Uncharacterized protein n=1 Tax=Mollisia scopiformis TaxID=149040 RepID=A0A194X5B9_MOLSC|nr:uncharacterized protein LY89DRAFT_648653 [Mollisia scopiformis]KUJ15383.1 hypothetical protein LY89DRAFT_648653 [Mollisia scopiformis]